jgi:DNA repair protein RadA
MVITNQVISTLDAIYGDPNKPTGGHFMAHARTHRVYLRKKDTRIATIIDSPYLPEEKARFSIIEMGVWDSDII